MLRRKPTRIDAKIDDIGEEWTTARREKKAQGTSDGTGGGGGGGQYPEALGHKSRKEIIHDRIGYEPQRTQQHGAPSREARLH